MKSPHETTQLAQYPEFWDEEWLKRAIAELDTRRMTPEERYQFARITARNAEAVNAEKRRGAEAVRRGLLNGLPVDLLAELNGVPGSFVQEIATQLNTTQADCICPR